MATSRAVLTVVKPGDNSYTVWEGDEETKRPFRLWDANAKQDMVHRYYAIRLNAINAALLEAAWARVGVSIEVYDCRDAKHIATFTRSASGQITRWLARGEETHVREERQEIADKKEADKKEATKTETK